MPDEPTTLPSSSLELQRRGGSRSGSEAQLAPTTVDSVPDGGYGWVVVFACAVLSATTLRQPVLISHFSPFSMVAALVKQGLSSASTLSFVGSSTVACISGLAVINARVIRFLGARRTALLGIFLIGLGEILSGFATLNIAALFVTTGAITGIGTRSRARVVSVTPAQYFNRRRGLANGIVYAGGGLGGAVTSFAMDGLIQSLGPAWTFRIIGLITLATGLPAAWLVQERTTIRTTGFIEWSLFRDFRFIVLFFAGAIGTFPLFVPPFFLPLYSASLGLAPSAGAGLVAGFNFSSALGRLGCGLASDRIGPVNVLFLALLLSALSMLAIWPVSTSLTPLVIFVVINGAANGGFFSTMPTVRHLGAPIAGYLLNAYGGADSTLSAYHPAMFYAGSMALGAGGLVSLVRLKTSTSIFIKV
ncbi:major facilitator superfamily domain-containing protein [Mycena crocata]|nr:major facilitator superfamily domain-containing protein [Mycena crocata]